MRIVSILSQLNSSKLEHIDIRLIYEYQYEPGDYSSCSSTFWPMVASALSRFSHLKTIVIEPLLHDDVDTIRRDLQSINLDGILTVRATDAKDDDYYASGYNG